MKNAIHNVMYDNFYYTIHVIVTTENQWVILKSKDMNSDNPFWARGLFHAWAKDNKTLDEELEHYESVAFEIHDRMTKMLELGRFDSPGLTLFPKGWKFWGGGIPKPLQEQITLSSIFPDIGADV